MKVPAVGGGYNPATSTTPTIVIHPLKENKRPVGFAPWPEPEHNLDKPES